MIIFAVGLALAFAQAAPARAVPLGVELRLEGCERLDQAAVRRLVEVELGATVDRRGDAASAPAGARAFVRCEAKRDHIAIDDGLTGKRLERAVELGPDAASPAAEARVLALSITELLAASWIELGMTHASAAPRGGAAVRAAWETAAKRWPRPEITAELFLSARGFGAQPPLWGVGTAIATHKGGLGACVDLVYERSDRAVSMGQVAMDVVTVAPAATWTAHPRVFTLAAALGARAGVASLVGTPDSAAPTPVLRKGARAVGVWGGPHAAAAAGWRLPGVTLTIGFEAGVALLGMGGLVADAREVELAGPWLAARLGVGRSFR